MARVPSSDPNPGLGKLSEATIASVCRARDEALRDLEAAEQNDDPESVGEARARVREAQGIINRYGLDR